MNRLRNNIEPGYFLCISYWVALSAKPGTAGMFVYPDGKYIVKRISFSFDRETQKDKESRKEGTLALEELHKVEGFIRENVRASSSKRITDAGHLVEVIKDGKSTLIENDDVIYKKLSELLQFREKDEGLQ